jgi:hypothetical protein
MTTPEPIIVFGRSVPFQSMDAHSSMFYLYGEVCIAAFAYPSDGWCIIATSPGIQCAGPKRPTLEEAEQAWLELASLETPLLAGRVLDGMTANQETSP